MPTAYQHRWRWVKHLDNHVTQYRCKNCEVLMTGTAVYEGKTRYTYEPEGIRDERCPKAPEPWSTVRINESFLRRLHETFGATPFTNKAAYQVYATHHADTWIAGVVCKGFGDITEPFLQMTVRNTLCAAAWRGRLTRLGPGRYQFETTE
jgi:hypothetical protein